VKLLDGIRVLTTALNVPGPAACARLRDLGAAITKIEPPAGDPLARYAPPWYADLHRGAEVLCLDLKSAAGRGRLAGLLDAADVLVTAQRPGALDRLGLGAAACAAHPRLCAVAIVGHAGAAAERAGHDLTYLAEHGLIEPGHLPRTLAADLAGAERTAQLALALLLARERGGSGGRVEMALADVAADLAAPRRHGMTRPDGVLGGGFAGYGTYPAADGHVAVAALEDRLGDALRTLLSIDMLSADEIAGALAARPAAEWEQRAREAGAPLVALRDEPRRAREA
jgi:crotonobetainyl-CoA:carnitine CoA-transferase CaiB-like acyl-CoA transferase